MSAPTLALTFQDLIIRVAEYLGMADYSGGTIAVPADAGDLERCKRIVNDGYRRFIGSNDKWQFLTPLFSITFVSSYTGTATSGSVTTLVDTTRTEVNNFFNGYTFSITGGTGAGQSGTITSYTSATHTFAFPALTTAPDSTSTYTVAPAVCVAGDNSRYYMPDGFFGRVMDPFTYGQSGPKIRVNEVHEERIRELNASGAASGDPQLVAFRPLPVTVAAEGQRWEAIFWPIPNNIYTVTSRARIFPDKLVNNGDFHIAGFSNDEAVLKACIAEAERQGDDVTGVQEKAFLAALQRSIDMDKQSAAKRLGDYGDKSENKAGYWQRPSNYYSVDTYNGIPV